MEGRTRPTSELRALVEAVTAGIDDPIDKAKALYQHVNELVATTQGENRAVAVALEKSGDRTVLFKALLDLAGVDSSWAFLRPREATLPKVDWSLPSAGQFPFRFVAIERAGLSPTFVTLDTRHLPFGRLGGSLRGGKAFLLGLTSSRIVPLPGLVPEEESMSFDVVIGQTTGSSADVRFRIVMRLARGYQQKERFRTVPAFQKQSLLQGLASQFYPGCKVKRGEFTNLNDENAPLTIEIELTAPQLVARSSLIKPLPQPLSLLRSLGGSVDRRHPLHLNRDRIQLDRVEIELSDEYGTDLLPKSTVLASPLGTFSLSYEQKGKSIVVTRDLVLLAGRLPASEYRDLVDFCERVDAAEAENVVLRPLK